MTSSTPADYTALTVLGVVPARAATSVDATQSTRNNDTIVVDTEGIEDDEELIEYNELVVDEEAACEREAKRKSLRKQIAATGLGMRRILVSEPIKSYFASPLLMEKISIEDIMREIPPEDLRYVGSVMDRIYMPVSFVQKWVLPTIRVQKALKESQDGNLQGGMEAAMLASIFDQSVMGFNKPVSTNLADNRALRSMVIHASSSCNLSISLLCFRIDSSKNLGLMPVGSLFVAVTVGVSRLVATEKLICRMGIVIEVHQVPFIFAVHFCFFRFSVHFAFLGDFSLRRLSLSEL
jgi:hypothetical protein